MYPLQKGCSFTIKAFFALLTILVIFFTAFVFSLGLIGKDLLSSIGPIKTASKILGVKNPQTSTSAAGTLISKFALVSDTHSDSENTRKAAQMAKDLGANYIVHGGDWTTVGTVEELTQQKKILTSTGLPLWGVIGDHDLWQSKTANFKRVFGYVYKSFDKNSVHHILMNGSDTDIGLGEEQLTWLEKDLAANPGKPTFIFMHLPPYHPYSSRTLWEKGGDNPAVKSQVDRFFKIITGKVQGIFTGDHHFSSSYTEPTSGVKITVVGAVTAERNLQEPRFDIVEVYSSGDFNVTQELIK